MSGNRKFSMESKYFHKEIKKKLEIFNFQFFFYAPKETWFDNIFSFKWKPTLGADHWAQIREARKIFVLWRVS